jgi:protein SCO1/2
MALPSKPWQAAQMSKRVDEMPAPPRFVSISIDPEHDTVKRLQAYAQRYNAGPNWQFLTGSLTDVNQALRAFDVYRGSKMNHEPTTLLRAAPHQQWMRLDGYPSGEALLDEYRRLSS